jgi:DNA-binding NarL/FixJ family response regulator
MDTNTLALGSEGIRVLIVEYGLALREGLRMRLAAETDLAVAGQAENCESALEQRASWCPDIALEDAEGPENWTAPKGALRSICRRAAVIVLSLYDDAITHTWVEHADTAAFVAKSVSSNALLTTIRQA